MNAFNCVYLIYIYIYITLSIHICIEREREDYIIEGLYGASENAVYLYIAI